MAEAVSEAGGPALNQLVVGVGGVILIAVSSPESVQVVENLGNKVCDTAVKICGLYAAYKLGKAAIDAAVKISLGGDRDDQEVRGTREGSLLVELHCNTDERFLELLEDYETGRMRERFQQEFSKIKEIKVRELKVEISNMDEVMKTKEAIVKRYYVHTQICINYLKF